MPATDALRLTLHLRRTRAWTPADLLALGALPPGRRAALPIGGEAPPEALAAIRSFAQAHGLEVAVEDAASHRVDVTGSAQALAEAFGHAAGPGSSPVPEALAPWVEGILGWDAAPRFRPHLHQHSFGIEGDGSAGFEVPALAARYAFPEGTGKGQRVGLIELGGGFGVEDLAAYFGALGLRVPTIRVVSVDGAQNAPKGGDDPETIEVTLDVEVLGALVPEAELVVYFAPNTDQGFLNAVKAATHDPEGVPSVLSISWGSAETSWPLMDALLLSDACMDAAAAGITLVASAGDKGSREDGAAQPAVVNFPASSPWVLGCGGTTADGADECVWNSAPAPGATGGGVSDFFELPDYQKGLNAPVSVNDGGARRVVPDLAAVADGATGYRVYVGGKGRVLGGTSAAAPLWAALLARCNASLGAPCGCLHPFLYGNAQARAAFRSILRGSNGDYHALSGYDACTGLGTPDGTKLLAALRGGGA